MPDDLQPCAELPVLKGRAPFRVGVTSYVYPDDILPNVEKLAPLIDDIELVLFESASASNLPPPEAVARLAALAAAHGLSYTAHLPIDTPLGSPNPARRAEARARLLRVMELAAPLRPWAWVLHLDGIAPDADPARVTAWQRELVPALADVAAASGDPALVAVENLDYPYAWCVPLLDRFGFSVCLDAGHLWATGADWRAHVRTHLPRTRVVHLYATRGGHEHFSLAEAPDGLAEEFLCALGGFAGVLTLETFGLEPTRSSLETLGRWLT